MTLINVLAPFYTSAKFYGAKGDGSTDDTTAIQNALNAITSGGGVFLPPGTYIISSPLSFATTQSYLLGAGPGSVLQASAGFSGAEMISITQDMCGVRDLRILGGPSTTSSSNVATIGIEVSSARYADIRNIQFYYINGYAVESTGGASINNAGGMFQSFHIEHCKTGVHLLGNSGSSNVGQAFLSNIHIEVVDNGDGLLLEDINDVLVTNLNGAVAGAGVSGSMIHVKGPCASCFFTNIDVGAISASTVSPVILVENDGNGSPTNISFDNGVAQQGLQGASVTAGTDIAFQRMRFKQNQGDGIVISTAGNVSLDDCIFATNNQSNTTAYDIDITQASNNTWVKGCRCETGVGSGAGLVTNPANDTNHKGYFFNTSFIGSGNTPSTVFNGSPQIVRGCPGYNPRGQITAPTITASPFSSNTSQHDVEIIFTAINSLTAFKVGGVSVGVLPVAGVPYHVPARQSLELDYSAGAPTWQWYAD